MLSLIRDGRNSEIVIKIYVVCGMSDRTYFSFQFDSGGALIAEATK